MKVAICSNSDYCIMILTPLLHRLAQPFSLFRAYYFCRVRKCLEEVIDDEEYGQTALEHVWHSCYYALICHIRTSISGWDEEQRERCNREISVLTVELAQLASLHKKRSALISVYMGDLRRYAFMLFSSDRERRLAILHYRYACPLAVVVFF